MAQVQDIPRVYSKAIRQILERQHATETADIIYGIAVECDHLTARIVDDAQTIAERFAAYADRVAAGELPGIPTRYTTALDVESNEAALRAKLQTIHHMLLCCYGSAKVDEWTNAISAAHAASRVEMQKKAARDVVRLDG